MTDAALLNYKQVADEMAVSERTVKRLVARKALRVVDLGHRTKRFRRVDVERAKAKLAGEARAEWK